MTVTFTMTDLTDKANCLVKVYRARVGATNVSAVLAQRRRDDGYAFGVSAVRDGGIVADWAHTYDSPEAALADLEIWSTSFFEIQEIVPELRAATIRRDE